MSLLTVRKHRHVRAKSYSRLMADAAFHARNARLTLEQAQAKAPEDERSTMDKAIAAAEQLRAYAKRSAHTAARRGGVRQESRVSR